MKLKKLDRQVIVITGGSSGIGLATARLAARRGARVVLASRDEGALRIAAESIRARGGVASWIAADVADPGQVQRIADHALEEFGGFDTWINNAAVSIYGRLTEAGLAEKRRLFDVNFWGTVHGCRTAIRHLRGRGGAIVNLGSVLSDRAIPLQGMYCASKHAVKAYTDALRMELEHDRLPISVSLVKPSAIDTPYYLNARTKMEGRPRAIPPLYAPEVVARAVLACAERPIRDVIVGGGGKLISLSEKLFPRILDRLMEKVIVEGQTGSEPPGEQRVGNLFSPGGRRPSASGGYRGHVSRTSLFTAASLHPAATAVAAAGMITFALLLASRARSGRDRPLGEEGHPPGRRLARRTPFIEPGLADSA